MRLTIENRDGTLSEQSASNPGYTERIEASEANPVSTGFLTDGFCHGEQAVRLVASELEKLAKAKTSSEDVASTAAGLARMLEGQDFVCLTNGTYEDDDHEDDEDEA